MPASTRHLHRPLLPGPHRNHRLRDVWENNQKTINQMKEDNYKIDNSNEGSVSGYIMERKILKAFANRNNMETIQAQVLRMPDKELIKAFNMLGDLKAAEDFIKAIKGDAGTGFITENRLLDK